MTGLDQGRCAMALVGGIALIAAIAPATPAAASPSLFLGERADLQDAGETQIEATFDLEPDDETDWEAEVGVEYGLTDRVQLNLEAPYSATDAGDGFGDLELGLAVLTSRETGLWPATAVAFSVSAPTGDETEGLGRGVWGYELSLAATKTLAPGAFLHVSGAYELADNVRDGTDRIDERAWTLGVGAAFAIAEDVFLIGEVTREREEEDDGTVSAVSYATPVALGVAFEPGDAWEFGVAALTDLDGEGDTHVRLMIDYSW